MLTDTAASRASLIEEMIGSRLWIWVKRECWETLGIVRFEISCPPLHNRFHALFLCHSVGPRNPRLQVPRNQYQNGLLSSFSCARTGLANSLCTWWSWKDSKRLLQQWQEKKPSQNGSRSGGIPFRASGGLGTGSGETCQAALAPTAALVLLGRCSWTTLLCLLLTEHQEKSIAAVECSGRREGEA